MINPELIEMIRCLETPDIVNLESLLHIEKAKRLREHLLANPGCKVRTLAYGFSDGPGKIIYFKTFNKKGDVVGTSQRYGDPRPEYTQDVISGSDFFTFSVVPGGESQWCVAPGELLEKVELA